MTPTALGPAEEYLNAYPLQNAKGIYEGQRSTNPGKRVFLLTRSGFAGSQRYAAAIWSGDIGSTWKDMKNQIAAGVKFSMSGLPYWTMDIGGFVVPEKFEKPNAEDLEEWRELNTRWYQFGAFVPLFRSHGQFPYREIFNIAPETHPAYKSFLYYDRLRYRLLPYIYSLAGAAYLNDYTIMRGLIMDFSTDTAVANITDQYMFGPSLLINPVCGFRQTTRKVYLPTGQGWFDIYSGTYFEGGKEINAVAPYERLPVFVKEGSIIPFGPALEFADQKKADTILLYVYGGRNASFTLYEDEGNNYNYEKGSYSTIRFNYSEKEKTIVIEGRHGTFSGMLKHRFFRLIYINPTSTAPLDFALTHGRLVKYYGREISVPIQTNGSYGKSRRAPGHS